MVSRKNWLNSTGTCSIVNDEYFSYRQQMTATYKGYRLFDRGFYSMTTRKHQGIIRTCIGFNTIDLDYADFNKGAEYSIKKEIENLTYELEVRHGKRKTEHNKAVIEGLEKRIVRLQGLLEE